MSRLSLRTALLVTFALAAPTAAAHHGWSGYHEEEFEITGTLESAVSLANPHGTMKVRADGHLWNAVLAPPARTERAGLRRDTIPVGTTVTLQGHRHRDPDTYEIKTERVVVDGRVFNVYPDRD